MRLLRGFLSPVEVAELGALDGEWLPGRQGTGYDKLPLRERLADHPAVLRARTVLVPHEDLWDVYVIRYTAAARAARRSSGRVARTNRPRPTRRPLGRLRDPLPRWRARSGS